MLCERLEIDIWEVVDAASTKPFGFMRFEPGPGMGGHCLPVDPFYLAYKAREHDFYTEFVELAGKTNQNQPLWCVTRIEHALNEVGKAVKGSRILHPRRRLQGRRRRHPRVARPEDHPPRSRARCGDLLPRLPRARAARARPALGRARGRAADCDLACIVTAHPEVDPARWSPRPRWCSTSAASPAGIEATNLVRL